MPNSSSTPYKPGGGLHYHSTSTNSRCSLMPINSSLYNSFRYISTPGFGRDGAIPTGSVVGSYHILSSMMQPMDLFSPTMQPTLSFLSVMHSNEIYDLGWSARHWAPNWLKNSTCLWGWRQCTVWWPR